MTQDELIERLTGIAKDLEISVEKMNARILDLINVIQEARVGVNKE